VEKLLHVLHRLVDAGNTVIVIEHNLDVVKTADWLVDLGPEGGDRGGYVIAEGTPEQVARVEGSATGEYLARVLRGEPLVPLSAVTFAQEAGRGTRPAAAVDIVRAPEKRAAAAGSNRRE
jgi:excinuclease ABC subunit A